MTLILRASKQSMPTNTSLNDPSQRLPEPCKVPLIALSNRGLMTISGQDARSFLQGLVTADLDSLVPGRALYSTLLTPQGKFLDDFFLLQPDSQMPNLIWLEAPKERLAPIAKRLSMYRLRADVKIEALAPPHHVYVSQAHEPTALTVMLPPEAGLWCSDPRPGSSHDLEPTADLPTIGSRYYSSQPITGAVAQGTAAHQAYERQRIRLGLPDGDQDVERERSTLLDNGFDRAGAIAWQKGCYMGQEITARMRYRGLAKWDLLPVTLEAGNFSDFDLGQGAVVSLDGKNVGQLRSCSGNVALARLRLEVLTGGLDRLLVHDQPLRVLGRVLGSSAQDTEGSGA